LAYTLIVQYFALLTGHTCLEALELLVGTNTSIPYFGLSMHQDRLHK